MIENSGVVFTSSLLAKNRKFIMILRGWLMFIAVKCRKFTSSTIELFRTADVLFNEKLADD